MYASSLKLVDRKKILKIRSQLEAGNEALDEQEVPVAQLYSCTHENLTSFADKGNVRAEPA